MALYAAKNEGRNCAIQFSRHDELGQIVATSSRRAASSTVVKR
ncbi:hypothetical protein ACU8V3_01365 [Cobetia marina]